MTIVVGNCYSLNKPSDKPVSCLIRSFSSYSQIVTLIPRFPFLENNVAVDVSNTKQSESAVTLNFLIKIQEFLGK